MLLFEGSGVFLPFPPLTLGRLLGHLATVHLSAGDTPRAVPLARDEIVKNGEEDLNKHANSDGNQDLGRIVEATEPIDQACLGLRIWQSIDESVSMLSILALKFGDVEETGIRGVEKSDATREVGAHDPILGVSGQESADHVAKLAHPPVKMKKND